MSETRRELSGTFSSLQKWEEAWANLAAPGCQLQSLRLYHTTPQQVVATCAALSINTTQKDLEVSPLEEEGAAAVASLLKSGHPLKCLQVGAVTTPAAAAALLAGCASPGCALVTLCLSGWGPEAVGAAAAGLAAAAAAHSQLHTLQLQGSRLDAAAATALGAALAAAPALTRLSLLACSWEGPGQGELLGQLLGAELAARGQLTQLDLRGSSLGCGGGAALGTFLGSCSSLEQLVAAECGLGDGGIHALATAAAAAAAAQQVTGGSSTTQGLLELVLDGNDASGAALSALSAWATCTIPNSSGSSQAGGSNSAGGPWQRLRVLKLSGNQLEGGDLAALAAGLGAAPRLEQLDLAHNRLMNVSPLAALLASPPCTLTTLELGHNAVGDDGAAALATALATNSSLTRLTLGHNRIKDKGACALAAALGAHPGPWCALDVSHCRYRDEGLNALLDAALENGGVMELGLEGSSATSHLLRTTAQDVGRALAARRKKGPSRRCSRPQSRRTSTLDGATAAIQTTTAAATSSTDDGLWPSLSGSAAGGGVVGAAEEPEVAAWRAWGPSSPVSSVEGGSPGRAAPAAAAPATAAELAAAPAAAAPAAEPKAAPAAAEPAAAPVAAAARPPPGAGSRRSSSHVSAALDPAPAPKAARLMTSSSEGEEEEEEEEETQEGGELPQQLGYLINSISSSSLGAPSAEELGEGGAALPPALSALPMHLVQRFSRSISLDGWGRALGAISRSSSSSQLPSGSPRTPPSSSSGSAGSLASYLAGEAAVFPSEEGGLGALVPVWAQPSLDAWAAEAATATLARSLSPLPRTGSAGSWSFRPISRSSSSSSGQGGALVRAGSLRPLAGTTTAAGGTRVVAVATRRGSKPGGSHDAAPAAAGGSPSRLQAMSRAAAEPPQLLQAVTPEPISLEVYKARRAAAAGRRNPGGTYRPGPWGALAAAGATLTTAAAAAAAPTSSSPGQQGVAGLGGGAAGEVGVRGGACLSAAFLEDDGEEEWQDPMTA